MNHRTRVISALWLGALAFAAPTAQAQTYVGNLNGVNSDSTIEGKPAGTLGAALGTAGWSVFSGSAQYFTSTANDMILGTSGYASYGVQYTFGAETLTANSAYTLSIRMGYVSAPRAPVGTYSLTLGTWNPGTLTFTPFTAATGSATGSGNVNQAIFSFGSASPSFGVTEPTLSVTQSINFTTGASVPGEAIAIRWNSTNPGVDPTNSDYLGVDNVALSVTAVPEPSTYAAIFGVCALGLAVWRRRCAR